MRHSTFALLVLLAGCGRSGSLPVDLPVPTPVDPGDGHDGTLDVTAPGTVVNLCRPVANADGSTVHLATPGGFAAGDRVLVWQVQDTLPDAGDPTDPPLGAGDLADAGRNEIATVAAADAATLTLAAPLAGSFSSAAGARAAQVCVLPQYSDVRVEAGASIAAAPWDGSTGGIAAFFAAGTLTLDGAIEADGAGFRGGLLQGDLDTYHVTVFDTTMGQGGGKGEGADARSRALAGRGDIANGAGGGNAHNAGGGGGGNGGRGGLGGREYGTPSLDKTQGLPGAPVVPPPSERLLPGGGGGAGQENNDLGGTGGAGGGVVLVIAAHATGAGTIHADGADGLAAGDVNDYGDGGGGGGAGGSIRLGIGHDELSGGVRARGGKGGDVLRAGQSHGPGGGGGGGRIEVSDDGAALPLDVAGGAPGSNVNDQGDAHGATAGAAGIATH